MKYFIVVPTGYEPTGLSLSDIAQWLLEFTGLKTDVMRDEAIRLKYRDGQSLSDIARVFELSPQRIFQIVRQKA